MAKKGVIKNDASEELYLATHIDLVEGLDEELGAINQNFEEVKEYIDEKVSDAGIDVDLTGYVKTINGVECIGENDLTLTAKDIQVGDRSEYFDGAEIDMALDGLVGNYQEVQNMVEELNKKIAAANKLLDTLETTISSVQSTANTAKTTADTALSNANTAKTAADNAQSTANSANTAANRTIEVAKGGTGSTSASAARAALGVPATSHASSATSYGVSTADNYGHAKASATAPKANGTAAIGTETASFARGDHVHPLQTTVSGNAGSATKLANSRTIGISGAVTGTATAFDGSANITIPITALNVSNATTGTLPIARGGTGATSASAALTALGAAASGHTHTSVAQLTNSRNFSITGGATAAAVGFNGTGNVALNVTGLNMGNANAGILPLARGGTGVGTQGEFWANRVAPGGSFTGPIDADFMDINYALNLGTSGTYGAQNIALKTFNGRLLSRKTFQAGSVSVTNTVTNAVHSQQVTFPEAFYTTPRVFVNANSAVPGTQLLGCNASSPTTTGFQLNINRTNATTTTVVWLAVADTASG